MAQLKLITKLINHLKPRRQLSSLRKGAFYENKACRYLQRQGLKLLTKNFRCQWGEIDLIMQDKECLVFIEVRYRQHAHRLSGLESINYPKQQRFLKTAEYYLQGIPYPEKACRFDIISFDHDHLNWIKEVF